MDFQEYIISFQWFAHLFGRLWGGWVYHFPGAWRWTDQEGSWVFWYNAWCSMYWLLTYIKWKVKMARAEYGKVQKDNWAILKKRADGKSKCQNLRDTEFRGICVGIRMAPTTRFPPESFSAGSGGLACDKNHSPEVQLQQLKVEEISPFFFLIFCQALDSASRYFHITVTVVTADLVFLDLPNIESVPSGEIQLQNLFAYFAWKDVMYMSWIWMKCTERSATAEARHSFKPRNSISWTDRNFKFPNGRRPKKEHSKQKTIILGQAWGSSRSLLQLCLELCLQRNPDFANMSDATCNLWLGWSPKWNKT